LNDGTGGGALSVMMKTRELKTINKNIYIEANNFLNSNIRPNKKIIITSSCGGCLHALVIHTEVAFLNNVRHE